MAAAGHEVDVRDRAEPGRAARGCAWRPGAGDPFGDEGHRRGTRGRLGPRRRRAGGNRARQRRRAGSDAARRDGRQRSAVQHPLSRRARGRAAAQPSPQYSAGARGARRRSLGAGKVGGRRAARQDSGHRRPRPNRGARRTADERVRDAARRLRPVRDRRSGPGRWESSLLELDELVAVSDFITHPPAEDAGDGRAVRQGAACESQARRPNRQCRPRRDSRRGGAG